MAVTSQNDGNDGPCDAAHCSLREAIVAANATDAADEIIFQAAAGTWARRSAGVGAGRR